MYSRLVLELSGCAYEFEVWIPEAYNFEIAGHLFSVVGLTFVLVASHSCYMIVYVLTGFLHGIS
ncbi:hypothetical protein ZIOFF_045922 [Zingiber officinale]|uniref:Uncharacterized protein n=1 Tax=Zingiber officinale TaxID=94328 RepID=A0A8J5G1V2_ZINOF|nr:hypothetical protein ZIOFF_045922 [Zingiber officinale]